MFNAKQYRDKATEYSERGKTASGPNETREFEQLEKSFTALADKNNGLPTITTIPCSLKPMMFSLGTGWANRKNMCCAAWELH